MTYGGGTWSEQLITMMGPYIPFSSISNFSFSLQRLWWVGEPLGRMLRRLRGRGGVYVGAACAVMAAGMMMTSLSMSSNMRGRQGDTGRGGGPQPGLMGGQEASQVREPDEGQ